MAEGDPEYTRRARSDLRKLGKVTAWFVVTWLRQWARGEHRAKPIPLHSSDPDPRYVRLHGGLAAGFRAMRPEELARAGRLMPAPLIVRVLPERELAKTRTEVLNAILEADDDA